MEFTKSQIAGLVLGYLQSEKCDKAFKSFLESSPNLNSTRNNIKTRKYFSTRVSGLCLNDFLREYSEIYCIVQERLEASNYYNDVHEHNGLTNQLLYLLDNHVSSNASSTPIQSTENPSLPTSGESLINDTIPSEEESPDDHTPRRRSNNKISQKSSYCIDKNEAFNVSEALLTQTLLENQGLREKLAETINNVRNTPENEKHHTEDNITAGASASHELDAVIRTVVQKTSEDPMYNKVIDEIIGTAFGEPNRRPPEMCPAQNSSTKSPQNHQKSEKRQIANDFLSIEDQNNDAIDQIIAASLNTSDPNPPPPPPPVNNQLANVSSKQAEVGTNNSEVVFFDGTLDTYLKTSNVQTNPLYINTGGLLMLPSNETNNKQFYFVNNPPIVNMAVPTLKLSDNDILTMPTIIVNDAGLNQPKKTKKMKTQPAVRKKITILPMPDPTEEFLTFKKKDKTAEKTPNQPASRIPTPNHQGSHIRNLNFASPTKNDEEKRENVAKNGEEKEKKAWDAGLRELIVPEELPVRVKPIKQPKPKLPTNKTPKRASTRIKSKKTPKPTNKQKKSKEIIEEDEDESNDVTVADKSKADTNFDQIQKEMSDFVEESKLLKTPITIRGAMSPPAKSMLPKTPAFDALGTPLNALIEQQLNSVDLTSIPTPIVPITPGFGLTPFEHYNNRGTDYSTSSSYYQPSDSEQSKSIGQLIEEAEKAKIETEAEKHQNADKIDLERSFEKSEEKFQNLHILSDVVVQGATDSRRPSCKAVTSSPQVTSKSEHVKRFNHAVIGKKNLNLLKKDDSGSSSDTNSSESDSDKTIGNDTVISKDDTAEIRQIVNDVEVKEMLLTQELSKEEHRKAMLANLKVVRQRTIEKIKNPTPVKKVRAVRKKPAPKLPPKKRGRKKMAEVLVEEKIEEEAEEKDLVKGLWKRGIHLIANKPKINVDKAEDVVKEKVEEVIVGNNTNNNEEEASEGVVFDLKVVEDCVSIENGGSRDVKRKKMADYNLVVLEKRLQATFFVERLKKDISATMTCSPFDVLLSLPVVAASIGENADEDDDLMDFALTGDPIIDSEKKDEKANENDTKSPMKSGVKRRRTRLSDDDHSPIDSKKIAGMRILTKIGVKNFLDKVHGE